jgi:hypothetical protein
MRTYTYALVATAALSGISFAKHCDDSLPVGQYRLVAEEPTKSASASGPIVTLPYEEHQAVVNVSLPQPCEPF